ncbi:MAG: hypothetical protein UW68_C0015G0040, partial [Candidatus Collierbacteria bacterium GW2011_GWB1_44_6]
RIIAEYRENIRLAEICGAELEDVYFARNELKWQKGYIEQNALSFNARIFSEKFKR